MKKEYLEPRLLLWEMVVERGFATSYEDGIEGTVTEGEEDNPFA